MVTGHGLQRKECFTVFLFPHSSFTFLNLLFLKFSLEYMALITLESYECLSKPRFSFPVFWAASSHWEPRSHHGLCWVLRKKKWRGLGSFAGEFNEHWCITRDTNNGKCCSLEEGGCKSPSTYFVPPMGQECSRHSISHKGEHLPQIHSVHSVNKSVSSLMNASLNSKETKRVIPLFENASFLLTNDKHTTCSFWENSMS